MQQCRKIREHWQGCTDGNVSILSVCFIAGSSDDQLTPKLVSRLKGHHVVDVACGGGDAHTLAVTDTGKERDENTGHCRHQSGHVA